MTGYERFGELAVDKVKPLIKRIDQKELEKSVGDSIEGISPKPILLGLTKEELFYRDVFWHFGEIRKSSENLEYVPIFINSFRKSKAYQEASITTTIYLRYHIEHYLQENYILLVRVKAFMDWLSREFKKEGRIRESLFVSKLKKAFENVTNNLRLVRGYHVHQARYDDNVLNVSTLFEIASSSDDEETKVVATLSYKRAKKDWSERIKKNNQALKESLDAIFEGLIPIVFPSVRE
jgi:hypothetical protein